MRSYLRALELVGIFLVFFTLGLAAMLLGMGWVVRLLQGY